MMIEEESERGMTVAEEKEETDPMTEREEEEVLSQSQLLDLVPRKPVDAVISTPRVEEVPRITRRGEVTGEGIEARVRGRRKIAEIGSLTGLRKGEMMKVVTGS